jgi:hypothetical protein
MRGVTDPLVVKITQGEVQGRGLARLVEPFQFTSRRYPDLDAIIVPEGFVTDFVSVPWFARPFIPVIGRAAKAAVLHDWTCTRFPRAMAAHLFLEAMILLHVDPLRRWFMFWAVRLFGPIPRHTETFPPLASRGQSGQPQRS